MKVPAQLVGIAAGKALPYFCTLLPNCLGMRLAIISPHFRALIHELKLTPGLRHPRGAVDMTQDLQDHKAALRVGSWKQPGHVG